MYRKYSGSAKCSRNERLAQLTEQESVIEKKKKEIQAKIEAQKKKETEEALKKLETSNSKNSPGPPKSLNWNRKENNVESEDIKSKCPRNAFTNDGSFLDQFRKLSKTGLDPGSVDVSTFTHQKQKAEFENRDSRFSKANESENGHTSCTQNSSGRNESNYQNTSTHIYSTGKYQSENEFLQHSSGLQHMQGTTYNHPIQSSDFPNTVNQNFSHTNQTSVSSGSSIKPLLPVIPNNVPPPLTSRQRSEFDSMKEIRSSSAHDAKYQGNKKNDLTTVSDDTYPLKKEQDTEKANAACRISSFQNSDIMPLAGSLSSVNNSEQSRISPALTPDSADKVMVDRCQRGERFEPIQEGTAHSQISEKLDFGSGTSSEHVDDAPGKHGHFAPSCDLKSSQQSERFSHPSNIYSDSDSDFEDQWHFNSRKIKKNSKYASDSSDSDTNSKDSFHSGDKVPSEDNRLTKNTKKAVKDGYQADYEDDSSVKINDTPRPKKMYKGSSDVLSEKTAEKDEAIERGSVSNEGVNGMPDKPRRKRKSRWGDEVVPANFPAVGVNPGIQLPSKIAPLTLSTGKMPMLSKLTRSDPGLIQYARQTFGSTNLSEEDWKKAEDHYKINLLYQDMVKKRAEIESLEKAGKFKYEYDSDEDVEGGTWEHKLRQQEMMATQLWAEELTRQAAGKHHIGDFLPPEELERFMEKYNAVKEGRNPDLSDYKEFKLKEDNVGYRLLQKMGWNEGQGLGQDGTGITHPVNKASTRHENQGLGVGRPDGLEAGDDEYDAYRKRMMLAYRFRPNPLNNPRRPYY